MSTGTMAVSTVTAMMSSSCCSSLDRLMATSIVVEMWLFDGVKPLYTYT